MYTALRCAVKVKKEFIPVIYSLCYADTNSEISPWQKISNEFPHYKFLAEWCKTRDPDMIPFGDICYHHGNHYCDITYDGYWFFYCSLKNYEGEIEKFVRLILRNMVDEVIYVKSHYEEMEDDEWEDLTNIFGEEEQEEAGGKEKQWSHVSNTYKVRIEGFYD